MTRLLAITAVLAAACFEPQPVEQCLFPSGRPCALGETCLNTAGDECNYVTCEERGGELRLVGTAVACAEGDVEPAPGGPFSCDPAEVEGTTPPQAPCPLGGLWTVEDGFWGRCVPTSQCEPLPCDPVFQDDGCPSFHVCDPVSDTCQVAASDAAS